MDAQTSASLPGILRSFKWQYGSVFGFSAVANFLLLAPSWYMLQVYDRVLYSGEASIRTLMKKLNTTAAPRGRAHRSRALRSSVLGLRITAASSDGLKRRKSIRYSIEQVDVKVGVQIEMKVKMPILRYHHRPLFSDQSTTIVFDK